MSTDITLIKSLFGFITQIKSWFNFLSTRHREQRQDAKIALDHLYEAFSQTQHYVSTLLLEKQRGLSASQRSSDNRQTEAALGNLWLKAASQFQYVNHQQAALWCRQEGQFWLNFQDWSRKDLKNLSKELNDMLDTLDRLKM